MGNKSSKTSNKARQVKHENQYPDTDISDRRHGDGDSPKPILRSAGPELSQQTRFLPHIPQFPPLSVHKDMSCQTNDSYLQAKSQKESLDKKCENDLDNKMNELLGNNRNSILYEKQNQLDASVYTTILWTVLVTSSLYYIFTKI